MPSNYVVGINSGLIYVLVFFGFVVFGVLISRSYKLTEVEREIKKEAEKFFKTISDFYDKISGMLIVFSVPKIKEDLKDSPEELYQFGELVGKNSTRSLISSISAFCANIEAEKDFPFLEIVYPLLEKYETNFPKTFQFSAKDPKSLIKDKEIFDRIYSELTALEKSIQAAMMNESVESIDCADDNETKKH